MKPTLVQHLAVVAVLVLDAIARGLRFRALVPMPLARAIGVNLCGDALGSLTPAQLGADPVRFAAVHGSGGAPASAVLAAFVTEFSMSVVATAAGAVVLSGLFAGAAAGFAHRLALLVAPSSALRVLVFVVLPTGASAALAVRLRHRLPPALVRHLRDVWVAVWRRPPSLVAGVAFLTLVSLASRTAVLPILAAGIPGVKAGVLILGSYLLLLGQAVLPTPAGAGGVELGFLAGFSGSLPGGTAGQLLVLWRFYTFLLALMVGALLLLRADWLQRVQLGLGALVKRKRQSPDAQEMSTRQPAADARSRHRAS